jgi:hypothetical protein
MTGGGHTAYNLLEPNPDGCCVHYLTLRGAAAQEPLFDGVADRTIWVPRVNLPGLHRRLLRIPSLKRYEDWRNARRNCWNADAIMSSVQAFERRRSGQLADCLLLSPQGEVQTSLAVAKRLSIPAVAWFMDDYFTAEADVKALDQLLRICDTSFVISTAMHRDFRERFGVETEVLNNSIDFPTSSPMADEYRSGPLRLVYAGSLNSYYADVFQFIVSVLQSAPQVASLDVYTSSPVHPDWSRMPEVISFHAPIRSCELQRVLPGYDAVLLLSSFEDSHKRLASTSQASKIADYLSAAIPVVSVGPAYAQNVQYVEENRLGVCVKEKSSYALVSELDRLTSDSKLRSTLGQSAFRFGQKRHDRKTNSRILWRAIKQAVELR